MAKILVHLTRGPEDPTVAALALLVARTAVAEGHEVTCFLAGDSVMLLRESVARSVVGLGTGAVSDHLQALVGAGATIWASGMSSKARGLEEGELVGAAFAMPDVLVRAAVDCDRMFTY